MTLLCLLQDDYDGNLLLLRPTSLFTRFFISNIFISNTRLKLSKRNQAIAKQHFKTELFLFEIIPFLHSCYHPKTIGNILKTVRNKCVCFSEIVWLIMMKLEIKMKKRSHRYGKIHRGLDMNRDTNIKYVLVWLCLYILSNT